MILICKTANCLLGAYFIAYSAVLKVVDEFVRMREITRSVKVALKCLIAVVLVDVDLPYWTSKVEHFVIFMAIFSNICTAHAQKRIFINFRCKFRHRRSICRPRFPIRVQHFSDLATFSVDFCILYAECPPYFYFRFVLTYWPRKYTTRVSPHVDNSHQVWSWYDHQLPSYSVYVCRYVTWPVTLTFDLLTLNSCHTWRVLWPEATAHAPNHVTVSRGWKTITFLESPTPICLFTIQLQLRYDDD